MAEHLAAFGPAIANHLWQSTAFAAAAWLLALALRGNAARIRYGVWLAASLKFLLPFSLLIAAGNLLPHRAQPVAPIVYSAIDVVEEPFALDLPPAPPAIPIPTLRERIASDLPITLAALWLLGAAIVLLRWTRSWLTVRRTLRASEPATHGRELSLLRNLEATSPGAPSKLRLGGKDTTDRVPHSSRVLGAMSGETDPLALRLSAARMEPGIFGILRPTLVWPRELSARLDDAHIEAILAHELAHVRRRDNLTAALHMLVETLFWFHPLVWWIERRLIAEREQACDEAVVASASTNLSTTADLYAEALLKTCRFCIESPLPCVAGVTGADLKRRVLEIATGRALLRISWPKKLLLTAASLCLIAAPVLLGQARAAQSIMRSALAAAPQPLQSAAHALLADASPASGSAAGDPSQSTPPTDTPDADMSLGPAFEVATIRPANPNDGRRMFGVQVDDSGNYVASAMSLSFIAQTAFVQGYGKGAVALSDTAPKWINSDSFDVHAKVDAAYMNGWATMTNAQRMERVKPMVRRLLVDRFHLKLRAEMRDVPAYALVQAKGGAKLKEVPPPAPADKDGTAASARPPATSQDLLPGQASCFATTCAAKAVQIDRLIGFIRSGAWVDRFVIDHTGLTGYYDFSFTRPTTSMASPHPTQNDDAPPFVQIGEELGLKFEPTKIPIKTFIIDSAEKPTVDGSELTTTTPADEANLSSAHRTWLDQDARWLITPQERADFLKLPSDAARSAFIDSFWSRRDPPDAAPGAYRQEIYTRIAYANANFAVRPTPGSSTTLGSATDRGRALITYGKPDSIATQPGSGDQTWLYRSLPGTTTGTGAALTLHFIRTPTGDLHLSTPWPNAGIAASTRRPPTFDAVSIRPINQNGTSVHLGFYGQPGGHVEFGGNVEMLIEYAFDLKTYQVTGAPEWVNSKGPNQDWVEMNAVPPDSSASRNIKVRNAEPTAEQREMLQSVLRDRFGLRCHFEAREGEVYLLTHGTGPLKLVPTKSPDADPRAIVTHWQGGIIDGDTTGTNTTMDYIATMFSRYLQMPVMNQTGIVGSWDYHLDAFDPENRDVQTAIFNVADRLGLKIKRGRGPVPTLVIDHIDHPSEN